jgi:hypothetical protein
LLPGLRDVRTPLAVGYLWFLVAWLVFAQDLPYESASPGSFVAGLAGLQGLLGGGAVVAAVSFSAFLVGSVVSFSFGFRPLRRLEDRARDNKDTTELELREYIGLELSKIGGEPTLLPDARLEDMLQIDDLRARLLVANQEMYGEYDRLEAEGTFRVNIAVPLAALAGACLLRPFSTLLVTIMFALSVIIVAGLLFYQGLRKHGLSSNVLARAVLAGVIEHSFIARARVAEAEKREEEARMLEIERQHRRQETRSAERRENLREVLANLTAAHGLKRQAEVALAARTLSKEDRIRYENESSRMAEEIDKRERELRRIFDED